MSDVYVMYSERGQWSDYGMTIMGVYANQWDAWIAAIAKSNLSPSRRRSWHPDGSMVFSVLVECPGKGIMKSDDTVTIMTMELE